MRRRSIIIVLLLLALVTSVGCSTGTNVPPKVDAPEVITPVQEKPEVITPVQEKPEVITPVQEKPVSTSPLRVDFLDVGQGDSILIHTPNSSWVLIDAGPGSYATTVVAYLKARGVKTLAAIICTHPHEDHIGGMPAVIKAFGVKSVYMPKASPRRRRLRTSSWQLRQKDS